MADILRPPLVSGGRRKSQIGFAQVATNLLVTTLAVVAVSLPPGKQVSNSSPQRNAQARVDSAPRSIALNPVAKIRQQYESAPPRKRAVQCDQYLNSVVRGINSNAKIQSLLQSAPVIRKLGTLLQPPNLLATTLAPSDAEQGDLFAAAGMGAVFDGRAVTYGFISAAVGAGSDDAGQTDGDGLVGAGVSLAAIADALAQATSAISAGLAAGEAWAAFAQSAATLAANAEFGAEFDAVTQSAQAGSLTAGTVASASFVAAVQTIASLSVGATLDIIFAAMAGAVGYVTADVAMGATFRGVGGDPDILPPATETLEIEPRTRKIHIVPRIRSIRLH